MMAELELHSALNANRWAEDPSLRQLTELRYRRTAEAIAEADFEDSETR